VISFSGGVRKTAYISTIKQQSFAGCKEKRPSINIPAAFFIFGGSLDKFCDLSFHYLGKVIQFYVKFRYKWLNYSVDTRKGWLVTKMRARKHFSFRGRNFKLSFSKWQERLRKRSPLRYFLKPKEDSRSSFGKRVDVLVGSFLIWLASFLVLSSLTNRPAASLALSLPLLVIEVLVLQRYRSLRERRFRLEQRLYHAGQKFLGEVSKMDPQREFCPYLRDLLAKLPGFEEVRLKGEKDQKGGQGNQGIDLEGVYQGSRVAVRCVLQEGDKKVLPDDIRDFAVLGVNIDKNPDVLQRIVDEGHGIINHSYSHDYNRVYKSPEAFLEELESCNESIAGITGRGVKIFRAPGGPSKLNKETFKLLKQHGYVSISWNVASADTDPKGVSREQIIENVQKGIMQIESFEKTPIVLMHDGTEINRNGAAPGSALANYIRSRESGVAALPEIIEFLMDRNYTFAVVDENTPPAW
jgi:peptidoglycan/xylan/chitin deacetylase (PgdA/CDA1 family)